MITVASGGAASGDEAQLDLRLAPPAGAAWLAAALALAAPARLVLPAATITAVSSVTLLLLAHHNPLTRTLAAALGCAAVSALIATAHAADLHRGPLPALAREHAQATIELTITSDPRLYRSAHGPPLLLFDGRANRVTSAGSVTRVRNPVLLLAHGSPRDWLSVLPSTQLTVTARVAPPSGPGDSVAAVLHIRKPPHITGPPTTLQRFAGRLRTGLRRATEGLPGDARALLPGLVIGDTSRIPPELTQAFQATDLTHLLSVSGANLTIILALLIGPTGRAIRVERGGLAPRLGIPLRLTAALGALLTAAFVILCRPQPSVLRAAACGLIALLAIGTGRNRAGLPALLAAVFFLILLDPLLARSYGFLLSVLATGALITLVPRWGAALQRHHVPGRLAQPLAAAAAAQAVCSPVIVLFAARVSLVGIACNLLAEFAVAPATVLGFAALALAPFAMPVAKPLAWLASWPTSWIATIARTGSALPGAQAHWPGGWIGALLLTALTLAAILLGRHLPYRRAIGAALAVLLILTILRPNPLTYLVTGWPPSGWKLVACDVGQGDALVLSAGKATAVVVDTGPDPALIDRCLRDLGVTRIPLLVLTHFHADHVGGLSGALRGRTIGAIQITKAANPPGEREMVIRRSVSARIPLLPPVPGERRRIGPLSWDVLGPPGTGFLAGDTNPNDSSVVILARIAGLSVLLLGDLEAEAQQRLLADNPNLPAVDVLKVAHHGSASQDPALLRRLHPRLALISVGRDNSYGHPAARTISTLRSLGTTVLRTDTSGSIAVRGSRKALEAEMSGGS